MVQKIEHLVKVTGNTVITGKLFHKILLDFGGAEAYNKHTPDDVVVFCGLPLSELPLWQGLFSCADGEPATADLLGVGFTDIG